MEDLDHRVAVVGAGYAGMAAAVTLADAGVHVVVFESGAVPGGRARRVHVHGRDLDNGQHILIGAYSELLHLMQRVGVPSDAVLRVPLELRYADGFVFRSLGLPAPLGLLGGLLALRTVSLAERFGAVRLMLSLKRRGFRLDPDIPVERLLEAHGQAGRIGDYLWRPLCVAALNTPPEEASAQVFAAVLRDSLAGSEDASDLLLPRVDLSQLFPERAAEYVRARGGKVRTGETVHGIEPGLRIAGESFSQVILAVAPYQLKPFASLLGDLPEYTYQPIYTCYLQYPGRVKLPFPMLGLSAGTAQWVFDRDALGGAQGLVSCMISAEGAHQRMTHAELAAICHGELARVVKALPAPKWSQVIAEKRATITCSPGIERPAQETPTSGLLLAGDYTDPEYPPVLEAAVRSGVRAAKKILAASPRKSS
ncbi:MAG TPA: hydroxysqualene dehydroxylase HpnE [Burkholderiales bacterium]|nr:hydroxysqualene dehydroxylase HpnE [Burkholderiales bacterium]